MNKIKELKYRQIQRISPSQFYSMKQCPYKSILAEAFERKPLLPISANAYFGTVLHKMLELIGKGLIKDDADFDYKFSEQVQIQEKLLISQGFNTLIPLQKTVKDYGIKKILIKRQLAPPLKNNISSTAKVNSEKWLESEDRLIGGKVDLIIEDGQYSEIVDFKTGGILSENLDDEGEIIVAVKNEYQDQLKLYAYLFFESKGWFPSRLSLIDLTKTKHFIQFTPDECKRLYDEAKILLNETNQSIVSGLMIANPSLENCKFCLYRPACTYFLNFLISNVQFNDLAGTIIRVEKYLNGNVTAFIIVGEQQISITKISKDLYPYLIGQLNKLVFFYNIKREAAQTVYSVTKTTMIYE